ncbi:MAG: FAD-binding protein [Actinomycetia bacterium]|nr:FAD-binding protein [Actinomycetes bacterium]
MPSSLQVDLLVIGSGASGMTTAARAAQAGARVLVVEKAPQTGGSAAISGGFVWTAAEVDALLAEDPGADPALVRALVEGFPAGIDWLRWLGLTLSDEITGIYGFGRGFRIDPNLYLDRCRSLVASAGGEVVVGTQVEELQRSGGSAAGALLTAPDGRQLAVDADWTVLATGGFQASSELRREHIHASADRMLVRANAHSSGGGLRLGLSVGAEATADMAGFYGHLVPSPLTAFPPESFIPFAQLHSAYCLLLDARGRRFTDESLGDHKNVQALVRHPSVTAILVADGEIHRTQVLSEYIPGLPSIDRLQVAVDAGARLAKEQSLAQLADSVAAWGADGARFLRTLTEYNEAARRNPSLLDPPRRKHLQPLETPPYFALEVQPAITFSYGGLRADAAGRVLGKDGPVGGLLAAGIDVGGVFHRGYAGGLARALVSGMRAAQTATGDAASSRRLGCAPRRRRSAPARARGQGPVDQEQRARGAPKEEDA